MQSFVGKLTHACPDYYCSRSARPRALPAGLSVVAADWPHVSNSGYDGSSGLQHHDLGATLHIVRNLYFQRGSLRLTGSLSVRAEGLLKVKVRDSVGAGAY